MSPIPLAPLPPFDRNLLRAVAPLVPADEREEWSRTWQAELWHLHHCSRSHSRTHQASPAWATLTGLSLGLALDALWLRTESWRSTFTGTATLCLGSLVGLSLLSTLLALALQGSGHALIPDLKAQFDRSLLTALLVLFVALATDSRRHLDAGPTTNPITWLKRQLFFAAKTLNVLFLAFLLSADLSLPVRIALPATSDLLQIFAFVLLALLGLRWALRDQDRRCKQCLHSLTTPARVGRPSHNLLEWNGTELNCKHGHGLLSVPEMETSWCRSSHWVDLHAA